MPKVNRSLANKLFNFIGLQTPIARIVFFLAISLIIFIIPYQTLMRSPNISIWSWLNIPAWSIGLTRAYSKLLHGDFHGAYKQNLLIYPVVIIVLAIMTSDIYKIAQKRN
ncbi:MAG: DUF2752 domain-containing protein [bacterium]|nr:DUF2752 domain-containing protein [bacterium]